MDTTTWICDTCGEIIEKPEDGLVEWITYEDSQGNIRGRDFRLVHRRPASPLKKSKCACQFDQKCENEKDKGIVSDYSLTAFLGADGLMFLLSKIVEGCLTTTEVLEMIKRLHIPGYESARKFFDRAISEDIIEPNMYPGYYYQREIKEVLKHKEEL